MCEKKRAGRGKHRHCARKGLGGKTGGKTGARQGEGDNSVRGEGCENGQRKDPLKKKNGGGHTDKKGSSGAPRQRAKQPPRSVNPRVSMGAGETVKKRETSWGANPNIWGIVKYL